MRLPLNLLFPPRCPLCGRASDPTLPTRFCRLCQEAYEKEIADGCPSCRKPFSLCECYPKHLRGIPFYFALPYNREGGRVRALILHNKRHKSPAILKELALRLLYLLREHGVATEDVLITYVPRSARRRREARLDQAEELARALARELKRPCLRLLSCRLGAREQKTLSSDNRKRAADGNFVIARRGRARLKGHRLLLIDDVITTGATLASCHRLLCEAGAKEVLCLAAARTLPERADGPLF